MPKSATTTAPCSRLVERRELAEQDASRRHQPGLKGAEAAKRAA